jgi:hypothetical protein
LQKKIRRTNTVGKGGAGKDALASNTFRR